MLLIDSSALVRFFSKEQGWETAAEFVASSSTISLALAELGSALLKKIIKNEVKPETASRLLGGYSASAVLVDQNTHLVLALGIAASGKSSIYDSLFIATALEGGYDLVSCDRRQAEVAEELGVKVIRLG